MIEETPWPQGQIIRTYKPQQVRLPEAPAYYGLDAHNVPFALADVLAWSAWHTEHPEQVWIGREEWTDTAGRLIEVSTRFFGTTGCLWETMVFVDHVPRHDLTKRTSTHTAATTIHAARLHICQEDYPQAREEEP